MTALMKSVRYFKCRPKSLLIIITIIGFCITFQLRQELIQPFSKKHYAVVNETVYEYLVSNPKCRIRSENPMDPTIREFIKKYDYELCSKIPLLSSIVKQPNETFALVLDHTISTIYEEFISCWTPIMREKISTPLVAGWDDRINVGNCTDFIDSVILPEGLEVVKVSCRPEGTTMNENPTMIYENIHAIINPRKAQIRLDSIESKADKHRKLSILVFGIDSVSRLNFLRSLPKTAKYLYESGWINLKGYNKVGQNTYPNLMPILTGQNESWVDHNCKPTEPYGLDKCRFLWHKFKKAGYVTAYAEDTYDVGTFNYLMPGFIDPPTDYYFRPYVIATETLLPLKKSFSVKSYCTGPESSFDRIFNLAKNFAETFQGKPFFGFFWTNSVTHNDVNGISSMDNHLVNQFKKLQELGILNDTMMVFLSDHGMRFGEIRQTFIGGYEDRLPFIHLRVPPWFDAKYNVTEALRNNVNRLTSPFDLYETFRDILTRAGGEAEPSSSCSTCQSLFNLVPIERSCTDAGTSTQWCACNSFKSLDPKSVIALERANIFLSYVEKIVEKFRDEKGRRLCAKLELNKIHSVKQVIDSSFEIKYEYQIEVTPGGGIFEVMMYINPNRPGIIRMPDGEITRLNLYAEDAKCLINNNSFKKYCSCVKGSIFWFW